MLEKLMEKKDLITYATFRIEHLELERQKIPYTMKDPEKREKAIIKIDGRIKELRKLKRSINKLKESSKYHYQKVQHLKKIKVAHLKGDLK